MPFSFFDHTGDVGIDLASSSLGGLFEAAAQAFTETLCDLESVRPTVERVVSLEAPSSELLLVEWLSELLYLFEVDEFLVHSAAVGLTETPTGLGLAATLSGEGLDPRTHRIRILVKGVTYHGLSIVTSGDGVRAAVILDI